MIFRRPPPRPAPTARGHFTIVPGSGPELDGSELARLAGVGVYFIHDAVKARRLKPFRLIAPRHYHFHTAELPDLLAIIRALPGFQRESDRDKGKRARRAEIADSLRRPVRTRGR